MQVLRRIAIATLTVAGALVLSTGTALAAPPPVTVPPNYVYNPDLGNLNDFCSSSPDQPAVSEGSSPGDIRTNVDFRGPCARHDLCYGGTASKETCDTGFRQLMGQQCLAEFAANRDLLDSCNGTADVYYDFAVEFGDAG